MRNITKNIVVIFCLSALNYNCHSQIEPKTICSENRKAFYAGQFYDEESKNLNANLDEFFKNAVQPSSKNVLAIIAPHAGYIFSGQVAASSYNQIDTNKQYKHVFILAPSHYFTFDGASVYCQGNFETPLGIVPVDCDFCYELISKHSEFQNLIEAHTKEHSIEVQLPFIQKKLKPGYKIIPIIIGNQDNSMLKKIATALKPYLNKENLFVISSDFSHYPKYNDANENDKASALAILKNSPKELENQLKLNDKRNVQNLATSMCGEACIMCLLYMTSEMKGVEYKLIDYKNSGDSKYGEKNRVVGYWAISLEGMVDEKETSLGFELNAEDKEELLKIARKTLEEYIKNGKEFKLEPDKYSNNMRTKCGAFVTLTKKGELRGCIGSFSEDMPVYEVVRDMAISASSTDPRFPKVRESELNDIEIEISVLSPMHKIDSISQVEIGKHGIYLKNGYRSGTLLPQVASENNWNAEEFVKYCAVYKAGIEESEIKNSELFVYEAIVFQEE
jgi:MEMO1 family protein